MLATTDWDGETKLWETHSGFLLFKAHTSLATVRFSRDDRRLSGTVWGTKKLRVWEVPRRIYRRFRELPFENGSYHASLAVSPDDRLLAVGQDKGVRIWDLHSKDVVAKLDRSGATFGVAFEGDRALWTYSPEGLWRWPLSAVAHDARGIGPPRCHLNDWYGSAISMDRGGQFLALRSPSGQHTLNLVPPGARMANGSPAPGLTRRCTCGMPRPGSRTKA